MKRAWLTLAICLSLGTFTACGGDDGGDDVDAAGGGDVDSMPDDGDDPDATPGSTPDATPGSTPDGMPGTVTLGTVCTPAGGECQSQETGLVCAVLMGQTSGFCTTACGTPDAPDNATCEGLGYAGPGQPACALPASTDEDMEPEVVACVIICEDPDGEPTYCDATTCDGTCPSGLSCTGAVPSEDQTMQVATFCSAGGGTALRLLR